MQNCEPTHTRLEAHDLLATLDCRSRPFLDRPSTRERKSPPPPPTLLHDFLVMSIRPDLTPELLAGTVPGDLQSCERNIPQK